MTIELILSLVITIVAFAPDPELLFNDTLLYVPSVKSTYRVDPTKKLALSQPPIESLSIVKLSPIL